MGPVYHPGTVGSCIILWEEVYFQIKRRWPEEMRKSTKKRNIEYPVHNKGGNFQMKRLLLILVAVILVGDLMISGCATG
jgi:hypothetical protein